MKKIAMAAIIFLVIAATAGASYSPEPLSWDNWAWGTPLASVANSLEVWGKFEQVEGGLLAGNPKNKIEIFSSGPTIFQKSFFDKAYIFVNGTFAGVRLTDTLKGAKEIEPVMKYLQSAFSPLKEDFSSKDGTLSYYLWRGYLASILCEDSRVRMRPLVYIGTAAFIESLLEALLAN